MEKQLDLTLVRLANEKAEIKQRNKKAREYCREKRESRSEKKNMIMTTIVLLGVLSVQLGMFVHLLTFRY